MYIPQVENVALSRPTILFPPEHLARVPDSSSASHEQPANRRQLNPGSIRASPRCLSPIFAFFALFAALNLKFLENFHLSLHTITSSAEDRAGSLENRFRFYPAYARD
jgi:hypothetical protein